MSETRIEDCEERGTPIKNEILDALHHLKPGKRIKLFSAYECNVFWATAKAQGKTVRVVRKSDELWYGYIDNPTGNTK